MRIIVLVVLSIFLSACATSNLTKEQCSEENWRAIAISDGLEGAPDDQILVRYKQCKKHAVKLDTAVYTQGYVDAILHRCTERYGYLIGYTSNLPKTESCPDYRRAEFLKGYNDGTRDSVADQLDLLLTKPEAKRKREQLMQELADNKSKRLAK